jgi:hypothetical protein
MNRGTGKLQTASNRADYTRTNRVCFIVVVVAILCISFVSFLISLDHLLPPKFAEDEPTQLYVVVPGQQDNIESDNGNSISLVETNQVSITFDSEESEVVKDQLKQQ